MFKTLAAIQDYECGDINSDDCLSEFKNAEENGTLDLFYRRCAKDGGENQLRKRCSLCCRNQQVDNQGTGKSLLC